MNRLVTCSLIVLFALPVVACREATTEPPAAVTDSSPSFTLSEKPADAISVLAAKGKAEGEAVVVTGRVSDMVKGFAAFTLTDDSVAYCGKGEEDCGCPTPWDYCCEEEAAKAGRLPVELRDAKGDPVTAEETGLRLLDLVIVKGTLAKTESGGLMILVKDGWFRAERPTLPDGLKWPQ